MNAHQAKVPAKGTREGRRACLALLAVLVCVAAILLVSMRIDWGGSGVGTPTQPAPKRPPGDPEPAAALQVYMAGRAGAKGRVVAWHKGAVRVADQVSEAEFRFSPPPPDDCLIVGWNTLGDSRLATSIGYVAYDGNANTITLEPAPVWRLRVVVHGAPSESAAGLRIGLRFPTAPGAARWAHMVELIGGQPAGYYLRQPSAPATFELPILPANTGIRVSAECGNLYAQSAELQLKSDREIELTLHRLASDRQVKVRDVLGAPAEVKLALDVVNGEDRRHTVVRSDASGIAAVPGDLNAQAHVRVTDDEWMSAQDTHTLAAGQHVLEITVWQTTTLRLSIEYDDGEPYYGPVWTSANLADGDQTAKKLWLANLVSPDTPIRKPQDEVERAKYGDPQIFHGVAEFYRVPRAAALKVTIPHERVGYPQFELTLDSHVIDPELIHKVVIPAKVTARSLSRIRIVGVDPPLEDLQAAVFRIIGDEIAPVCRFVLSESNESRSLHPGRYVVRISGAQSWLSGEIELPPAVTHDVLARLSPGGTVTARVMNEDGNPLQGATLDVASLGAPTYPAAAEFGVISVADASGAVELAGQPAGQTLYRIEAPGYQPVLINATPQAGSIESLGDVRLARAVGEVRIHLAADRDRATPLEASCHVPWEGGRWTTAREVGDQIVIRGVPVDRTYSVSVKSQAGGPSLKIFNNVRPTAAEPVVVLDATDIEVSD